MSFRVLSETLDDEGLPFRPAPRRGPSSWGCLAGPGRTRTYTCQEKRWVHLSSVLKVPVKKSTREKGVDFYGELVLPAAYIGASRGGGGGGEVVARKEKVVLPCGHGDVEVAREEHLSAWAADRRRRRFAIVRRRRRRQRRWREADEGGFQRRGKPARLSLSY
jgi:hypothetical protein